MTVIWRRIGVEREGVSASLRAPASAATAAAVECDGTDEKGH